MSLATNRKTWAPISESERNEIEEELERVLASAPFRSSRRYPSLLRYVVTKALSGEADSLKERTLGVEVFHRPVDYDTSADPVVRFSAGEVRRRLAQYYRDEANHKHIEIELPIGSYVPEFCLFGSPEDQSPIPHEPDAIKTEGSGSTPHEEPYSLDIAALRNRGKIAVQPDSRRRSFFSGAIVGVIVITALGLIGYSLLPRFSPRVTKTPIQELWGPLLTHPDAVIISVGRTKVADTERPEPLNATIEQHILRPDARISLAAVQAVSQVAGFLQAQHKQFRIHEAYTTSLQDLHRRPVTLVTGYNNVWTMRLLEHLRFRFEQAGSLHYIFDTQHPERRDWSVDFDTPYLQQTVDYAIIARFYDPTTEGPVVVVAGIGSNGSQAAGEFVVSDDSLEALAHSVPHNSLDQNFEAVLKVQVIGGNTGAATIVASQFW